MITVTDLYRYPVKGLSPEPLAQVALTAGRGFPMDRAFALARPGVVFDPAAPVAHAKHFFLVLAQEESLAGLAARYDDATGILSISPKAGGAGVSASLATAEGRATIEAYFRDFMGARLDAAPSLVSAPDFAFTDMAPAGREPMFAVSLINLASVRDLADRTGQPIDPLRFRGNIHLDGLAPFAEFDWVGKEVSIGNVRLEVFHRTKRCTATEVDTATGARDMKILEALKNNYDHFLMGVYAHVRAGGVVKTGDRLAV